MPQDVDCTSDINRVIPCSKGGIPCIRLVGVTMLLPSVVFDDTVPGKHQGARSASGKVGALAA